MATFGGYCLKIGAALSAPARRNRVKIHSCSYLAHCSEENIMFLSEQTHMFNYFICYHQESGWHVTIPNQGLSLGRGNSLGSRLQLDPSSYDQLDIIGSLSHWLFWLEENKPKTGSNSNIVKSPAVATCSVMLGRFGQNFDKILISKRKIVWLRNVSRKTSVEYS